MHSLLLPDVPGMTTLMTSTATQEFQVASIPNATFPFSINFPHSITFLLFVPSSSCDTFETIPIIIFINAICAAEVSENKWDGVPFSTSSTQEQCSLPSLGLFSRLAVLIRCILVAMFHLTGGQQRQGILLPGTCDLSSTTVSGRKNEWDP